jgi:glycosyltransferase involved in cell wall biosynthesis
MPAVSICLTTHNRAHLLGRTLESLLGQSFADFELIVSDDCSTDRTCEVVATWAARDARIRYRRNSTNLGMPGNLNAAIAQAEGDYIANLHDGDIYRPDLIEKWRTALDTHVLSPFVFNAYDCQLPSGKHRIDCITTEPIVVGTSIARYYFSTFSSCVWGTVMARREAYEAAGPFDSRFGFISDVAMWLRLGCGADVAYVPEPLMTLTPREADRLYYGYPWLQTFWALGIYVQALQDYRVLMPAEVQRYAQRLPSLIRKRWLRHLLSALRRRRWDRLQEGLSVCRQSPDRLLRGLGSLSRGPTPEWYHRDRWAPMDRSRPSEIAGTVTANALVVPETEWSERN